MSQPSRTAATASWNRFSAPQSSIIAATARRTVRVETSSLRAIASSLLPTASRDRMACRIWLTVLVPDSAVARSSTSWKSATRPSTSGAESMSIEPRVWSVGSRGT